MANQASRVEESVQESVLTEEEQSQSQKSDRHLNLKDMQCACLGSMYTKRHAKDEGQLRDQE